MRPRGLLLRVHPALRPFALRLGAAGLALLLLAPGPVAGRALAPDTDARAAPPAALPPPPGRTELVSERFRGGFPGGGSGEPSISANGRWVAFTSGAADLVAGDDNDALDVFVRDRRTGKTIRLPVVGGRPVPPGGRAWQPSIADDGSIVAFTYQPPPSAATVATGTLVLAWERRTGRTRYVSVNVRGLPADGSREPSVSGDGRYVAFTSDNELIVLRDRNGSPDVFRHDLRDEESVLVSVGFAGVTVHGDHRDPSISDDGNLVAFASDAGDAIVDENTGGDHQVYVRDIGARRTERISGAAPTGAGPANGRSGAPSISGNGRYVAFESAASNLVAGDDNGVPDVFRRDRRNGVTELVSVRPDGSPADGASGEASITRDGRMVAFTSNAADMLGGLPGTRLAALVRGESEVYIRDVVSGETVLVSVGIDGARGQGRSYAPSTDGGGRYTAFAGNSDRLVRGDNNENLDVFLRDLPPAPVLNPPVVDFGARAVGADPVPGAAVLANTGWGALAVSGAKVTGKARGDFPIAVDGCADAVLYRGAACTVTVMFKPSGSGNRTATLEVADSFTGSPRTARLRGSGSLAELLLDPPVGPPGIVTMARGSGFPPGAQVRLSWSRGMTPNLPVVTVGDDGRFEIGVLVFHHDTIGKRDLVAEPAGAAPFPPAQAEMLVSTPSSMPPGFIALYRIVDLPLVLVIRG